MTEKTSKVVLAAYSRSFSGQYGTFYVHTVTFENGDSGEYTSKTQEQSNFVVGQEARYTIDNSNPAYPAKIKPVQEQKASGGFGKSDPAKNKSIQRQTALKAAVEISPSLGVKAISEIIKIADTFNAWIEAEPQAPVAQKPEEQTGTVNDLPF